MSSYTTHAILTVQHHFTQVAYPLINLVTRLPQTLSGQCPISFRCRTFETFSLSFERDPDATDVFESVKELTVASKHTFVSAAQSLTYDRLGDAAICFLLHTLPTPIYLRWLGSVLPTRRVWTYGCRDALQSVALHRHQQGLHRTFTHTHATNDIYL